jgi:hypothetical protein
MTSEFTQKFGEICDPQIRYNALLFQWWIPNMFDRIESLPLSADVYPDRRLPIRLPIAFPVAALITLSSYGYCCLCAMWRETSLNDHYFVLLRYIDAKSGNFFESLEINREDSQKVHVRELGFSEP